MPFTIVSLIHTLSSVYQKRVIPWLKLEFSLVGCRSKMGAKLVSLNYRFSVLIQKDRLVCIKEIIKFAISHFL